MKWLTILTFFLYSLSLASLAQESEWLDPDQLRDLTIYQVLETNEPYEAVEARYQKLLRDAEYSGNDSLQAICLFQLAHINYTETHYSHSLAWTKKGMAVARRLNDHEMLAVGYDLLGRLHYLYSPEQAQYYYRRCWQHCQQSTSNQLAITSLNSYTMIRYDYSESLNSLLSIDLQLLTDLPRARLCYLIARSLTDAGRIDEALHYLENTAEYLERHHGTSPLNIRYEQQMAKIMLHQGNIQSAWDYLRKSFEIARKNKLLQEQAETYRLASEVAQAENQGALALEYYQKNMSLRDSILSTANNLHFADELLHTMVEYITEDEHSIKNRRNQQTLFYTILAILFILGLCLIYWYKSKFYGRKTNTALTGIKAQTKTEYRVQFNKLLMRLVYSYKAGFYTCMKRTLAMKQQPGNTGDNMYDIMLHQHSRKADELIDMLFNWIGSGTDMQPRPVEFDAKSLVEQIAALYQIAFSSKDLTYRLFIGGAPLIVYGDKIMFAIAIEQLFYRISKTAALNDTICISITKDESGQFVFAISNPGDKQITYGKEIFARQIESFENTRKEIHTADWDFNIFAKCLLKSHAKIRFHFSADAGTGSNLTIPAA